MISTRTHGILDYIIGLALIAAPWLFGFAESGAATATPVTIGAAIILFSLFTNYELGVVRVIPMKVHLGLDLVLGIFLAISPWLLAYAEIIWWPHLIVGLVVLLSATMTEKISPTERATLHHG